MTTVQAAWESYRRKVIPIAASDTQVQETRRAFYAGAQMLLQAILQGLTPGREPQRADEHLLAGIDLELKRFAESVQNGRA
jgi:hypothetical protein